MGLAIFLLTAALLSASDAESEVFNPIRLPWPRSAPSRKDLDCLSWRLAVETNNHQGWAVVPMSCKGYIKNYMQKGQYRRDCEEMVAAAIEFAESFKLAGDGKDVWVFDIDETTLSNLDYYARPYVQYGTIPYNSTKFNNWLLEGNANAVPGMLNLYNTLLSLGFNTVILTGKRDKYKEIRAENLKKVGYDKWTRLIFRPEDAPSASFKSTKRTELVEEGFRIVGNVGDQWSDLLGPNAGNRTFKVPNPMYYT